MKRLRKALAIFLCVALTLTAAPLGGFVGLDLPSLFDFKAEAASYSGTCGDNLTWSLDTETGLLEISGSGSMSSFTFYGAKVKKTDAPWFEYSSYIKTVNITSGVTNIGMAAFAFCSSIERVTISDSVSSISIFSFFDCDSLEEIVLSDGLERIENSAFYSCDNLQSINIPDSVTSIDSGAFGGSKLMYITVEANNQYYSSDENGVLFNKNKTELIQYPEGKTETSYIIPDGVTTICGFGGSNNLTSITIPKSVTTIGNSAFRSCYSLTDVYYSSTEDDWNKISIGSDNDRVTNATIHFKFPTHTHMCEWFIWPEPTATQEGFKNKVCSTCGEVVESTIIPATGFEATNGLNIDYANNIVYGLAAGIDSIEIYTNIIADGAEWVYEETQNGFGTGTKAMLKSGDEIVSEYIILIFGDVDGNGWYDANDAFLVNMIASGLISADRLSEAQFRAADCNHDGVIDSADFYLLNQASLMLEDIDQSATRQELVTNSVYITYCSLIDQTAGEETNLVPMPDLDEAPSDNAADAEIKDTEENKPADEINLEIIFTTIFDFIKKIFTLVLPFIVK